LEADVARDGLRVGGASDRTDPKVARDGLRGDVPVDVIEAGVAADRLELRVPGDPAAHLRVAGDGVHGELAELTAEARVRGSGLDLDVRAVWDPGPHAEVAV